MEDGPALSCEALPEDFFDNVSAYMDAAVDKGFSGIVLVAKDGVPVFQKGYGLSNREKGIPFSEKTVFDTGSVTKQFTGAALSQLIAAGKVSPTDTLSKYFEDLRERFLTS